jgi:hypothetical protein
MKIALNIVKILVTAILTLSIILLLLMDIATSTILNKNYIVDQLEETNYYANIYTQVKSNFKKYIYQSGLDESVLDNIVSADEVKNDIDSIIDNIYDGTNIELDYSNLREKLSANIDNYLEEENISLTTENQVAVNKFIDKIVEEYENTIFHTSYEDDAYAIIKKVVDLVGKTQIALAIVAVISIIILLVLNIKNKLKVLSYISISFASAGGFFMVIDKFISSKITIDNIMILNTSTAITLRYILNSIMSCVRYLENLFLIMGLVLIVISSIIIASKKEKNKVK